MRSTLTQRKVEALIQDTETLRVYVIDAFRKPARGCDNEDYADDVSVPPSVPPIYTPAQTNWEESTGKEISNDVRRR